MKDDISLKGRIRLLDQEDFFILSGIVIVFVLVAWRIGFLYGQKGLRPSGKPYIIHDPLTGLLFRQPFLEKLNERIRKAQDGQSFSVAIFNINRFRWINDSLGADVGDLVIKFVAEHMRSVMGNGANIARLNGDEFAVIFENDLDESVRKASSIVRTFEDTPIVLRGKHIHILTSAGLAGYPQHGATASEILGHADTALSSARQNCSGVVVFDCAMDRELRDRFILATELRFAINKREFSLHYQPRIDLTTGRIATVEALLRWHHSELGAIPPSQFIPIAEQTGSIMPIGLWVLETACEQAVRWDQVMDNDCRISINISVHQLLGPGFVESLDTILRRTGLAPHKLELELTESIFIEQPQKINGILEKVKEMGIRIAIDDFGKGYSSLNYLKSYPADTLKIDKDFITDMRSTNGRVILTSVIEMAKKLGLTIVAEGVEQPSQLQYLMDKECHEVQGYLLCKPVPALECERFMRSFHLADLLALFHDRQTAYSI